jgi:hypothetical protein
MRTSMSMLLPALAIIASCGDNIRPVPSIETRLDKGIYVAGELVPASCEIFDAQGKRAVDADGTPLAETTELSIVYQAADSFGQDTTGAVFARRAGEASVRCSAPTLGLVDETPELIQIVPGPVVRVATELAAETTYAGQPVGTACIGFDAYDNPVTGFPHDLAILPSGAGTSVAADSVTANIAGNYNVTCLVPGIEQIDDDSLLVLPALPASLLVHLEPERPFYWIDQEVTIVADAYDMFGNRVDDASFSYTANPTIPSPSSARYQFVQDGSFTLTAAVTSATHQDVPLSKSVQVVVNTTGPVIECMRIDAPSQSLDAYMIAQAPGSVTVPVRVSDTFAVQSVTIAGQAGTFDAASGNYRANVPFGFGMNFVDVVAVDEHGAENSTTCFVLAASQYGGESAHMAGAVALRLDPRAISDSSTAVLDSLNDILQTVIRSDELRSLVNGGLLDANPINDGSCGFFACEPDVNYNNNTLNWNTPSSTISLTNGGLQVAVTLPNLTAQVRVCGTTCCPGGSTVTLGINQVNAIVGFNLFLQNGVLRAAVNGNPNVIVGNVSVNGSGFCGFIIEQLAGIFEGAIRNAIRDALSNYIQSDLGPILDELVSSIDVNTLGQTFQVPRLDGTGTIDVGFGLSLSSLDIVPARLLLGIGTRFTPATIGHNRPSLGIAMRTPSALLDPPGTSTARPVGLTLYEGVMNEVLHALWRGGFFQATLNLGGGTAVIDSKLPAVVAFTPNNRANLMLGGIHAIITIPGIVSDLQVTFGGKASAAVTLTGNELAFGSLTINELFVSFSRPLTQGQRDALEDFLRDVLQSVLIDAINDGLPAIPIPTFTLPPSVGPFGLPVGAELGIVNPLLTTSGSHYNLTGSFGVRN